MLGEIAENNDVRQRHGH